MREGRWWSRTPEPAGESANTPLYGGLRSSGSSGRRTGKPRPSSDCSCGPAPDAPGLGSQTWSHPPAPGMGSRARPKSGRESQGGNRTAPEVQDRLANNQEQVFQCPTTGPWRLHEPERPISGRCFGLFVCLLVCLFVRLWGVQGTRCPGQTLPLEWRLHSQVKRGSLHMTEPAVRPGCGQRRHRLAAMGSRDPMYRRRVVQFDAC
jgi:hypothetical protein